MNLRVDISANLWDSIAGPYESGSYAHAVLEAIHYLTTVLRERSGAEGDGASLVGQALGGEVPRLRVNAMQSESERNVQKGLEQLIRGIYLAIRNPRSHETFKDTKDDADSIIHFVDYVVRILNASTEAFTLETFLKSVSDSEFVESQRYAELLASEVPPNKRSDALVALFGIRREVDPRKLRFLVPTLQALLTDVQLAQYLAVVSDDLRSATEDAAVRTALQVMTPDLWPRVSETARLRIENKLIRDLKLGEILAGGKVTGALVSRVRSSMN